MTTFEIVTIEERPAAVVRDELPVDQLPTLFDRAFHEVIAVLDDQGVPLVGPPFGFYPRMPNETVAVAAGFPVARPILAAGSVEPMVLPGGRAVRGVHVGSYEALAGTYEELLAWAAAEGLTLGDQMWETYLSDPSSTDQADWQTEFTWPLRDG